MRKYLMGLTAVFAIALCFAVLTATVREAMKPTYPSEYAVSTPSPAMQYTSEPEPWQPQTYKEEVKATKALKAWGTSKARLQLFKDVDKAQVLIAKAIESGKLGDVLRYDYDGVPWPDKTEGWGVLIVRDPYGSDYEDRNRAMAEVYFRSDGSVDYSQGVPNASIDLGLKYLGIQLMDDSLSAGVKYNVFLDTAMDYSGAALSSCFEDCSVSLYGTDGRYTTWDVNQLIGWEKLAVTALDQNLTSVRGPEWRTKSVK